MTFLIDTNILITIAYYDKAHNTNELKEIFYYYTDEYLKLVIKDEFREHFKTILDNNFHYVDDQPDIDNHITEFLTEIFSMDYDLASSFQSHKGGINDTKLLAEAYYLKNNKHDYELLSRETNFKIISDMLNLKLSCDLEIIIQVKNKDLITQQECEKLITTIKNSNLRPPKIYNNITC